MGYKDAFEQANARFLHIFAQFKEFEAINDELRRITKSKNFRAHNSMMYHMYTNLFSIVIIQLDDFLLSMTQKNSPFYEAKNNKIDFFFLPKNIYSSLQEEIHDNYRRRIISDNFTCNCPFKLCDCCFDFFIVEFGKLQKLTDEHRNKIAHQFQTRNEKKERRYLQISDVDDLFIKINQLMSLLTWFSDIKWYDNTPSSSEDAVAKDITDQILCGMMDNIPIRKCNIDFKSPFKNKSDRIKFYTKLHINHDKLSQSDQEKILFNDKTKHNSKGIFFSPKLLNFRKMKFDWNEFSKEKH